ncbi:H-NS family nucleoid-associated regulatory protein [Ralstonia sp. Ralssp110]|uniref:H-NS histone family protein n=1 Tax=Ralstonia sp. Ralssp110 TaxID=3243004 RepID=UPI0039B566AC
MATYKELLAQKEKLEQQLAAAHAAELETAIAQTRQIVVEYGLTAEDLGLATKAKKRKGGTVAPKYQDPKSGATWTGRGRAPAWIAGKNFERFLIKSR